MTRTQLGLLSVVGVGATLLVGSLLWSSRSSDGERIEGGLVRELNGEALSAALKVTSLDDARLAVENLLAAVHLGEGPHLDAPAPVLSAVHASQLQEHLFGLPHEGAEQLAVLLQLIHQVDHLRGGRVLYAAPVPRLGNMRRRHDLT